MRVCGYRLSGSLSFAATSWRSSGAQVAIEESGGEIMRVALMLFAVLSLTTISANGGEHLRVAASPLISFAPSNVRIQVRIVPSDENRALEVVAESGEFYRSSLVQLEGAGAPAAMLFEFRDLPGGEYHVYGILTDSAGGQRAVAHQTLKVLPSGAGN
jgi:hypothetical protein